jgi:hypothetical protein
LYLVQRQRIRLIKQGVSNSQKTEVITPTPVRAITRKQGNPIRANPAKHPGLIGPVERKTKLPIMPNPGSLGRVIAVKAAANGAENLSQNRGTAILAVIRGMAILAVIRGMGILPRINHGLEARATFGKCRLYAILLPGMLR